MARADERSSESASGPTPSRPRRPRPRSRQSGTAPSGRRGRHEGRPSRPRQGPGNPFKRLSRFLREVIAELRKVIWPNRKQMITYTSVVLVFVVFMVAFISGLDLAFIKGVSWLFG